MKIQNYDDSACDVTMEKIDEKVLPLGLKDADIRPMKVDDTYEIKSKKFRGLKGFAPTENGKDPKKEIKQKRMTCDMCGVGSGSFIEISI